MLPFHATASVSKAQHASGVSSGVSMQLAFAVRMNPFSNRISKSEIMASDILPL